MDKEKSFYKIIGNDKEYQRYFPYRDEANLDSEKFPIHIESVGITKPDPHYMVYRNDWNIFTIEFIVSGEGFLNYDGREYPLKTDDLYIIYPHTKQHYGPDKNNPYEKIWVNFRSNSFINLLKMFNLYGKNVFHFPKGREYLTQILELQNKYSTVETSSFPCLGILFDLLMELSKQVNVEKENIPENIKQIAKYIDSKTPEPVSIKNLCEFASMSQTSIIKNFKKYYKVTPYDYQLNSRLQLAKMYLINTNKPLDEIASICYFYDSFALSKAFKKMFGCSPRDFKKTL